MPRPRSISDDAVLDAVLELAYREGPARVTFAAASAAIGLSPATLVQRFGSKRAMLLAADRRAVDVWVGAWDRTGATSPLSRVVEGFVIGTNQVASPEQMANSVAMLQLDVSDPEFHAETLRGARAVRARIVDGLGAAVEAGELRPDTDVVMLAKALETSYHGSMIAWAIHREGSLADWMREQIEFILVPHRSPVI